MKIERAGQIIGGPSGAITIQLMPENPRFDTIQIPATREEERAAGAFLRRDVTITIEIPDK